MPVVSGIIKSGDSLPLAVVVVFRTVSAPTLGSNYVVSRTEKRVTCDTSGIFTVALEAGDWTATWTNGSIETTVGFAVPSGGGPYSFNSLVTDALTYTYAVEPQYVLAEEPNAGWRWRSGYWQAYNHTTAKWHTLFPTGPEGAVSSAWGPGET